MKFCRRMVSTTVALLACLGLTGCPDGPQLTGGPFREEVETGRAFYPPLSVTHWLKYGPVHEREPGKIYLIDFWATWCPPSVDIVDELTELQRKYRDQGLVVIGISEEDPELLLPYLARRGEEMDYVVATDTTFQTFVDYDVDYIPYAFLFDQNGVIVWADYTNVAHGLNPTLEPAIQALLQ